MNGDSYMDADMLVVDAVGDEILTELMAVQHPGFFFRPRSSFPYSRDYRSEANIAYGRGIHYFCGGFNGGSKYLDMAIEIKKMVDIDTKRGVIPVWHDESYLNKYLIKKTPTKVFNPDYCFPQSNDKALKWDISFIEPKILALEKDHNADRRL